jgi:hypothetical protein
MAAGEIHEVRSPKSGPRGTISGYFDDPETLAKLARFFLSTGSCLASTSR